MKRTFAVDPWMIATHQFHPEDKRLQESLTAIGNGYMGMRGNFEEQYSGISFRELISVVFGFRIKLALVGGKTAILRTLAKQSMHPAFCQFASK